MSDETREERLQRLLAPILAEFVRIGFTEEDLGELGTGSEPTEAECARQLAELRDVPSGIGAQAYYARLGFDLEASRRERREVMGDGAT